jgi:ATP-dependent Clp protease ATP-binding subunit ClpC
VNWNGLVALVVIALIYGFVFRRWIRPWLERRRQARAKPPAAPPEIIPPAQFDQTALTARLYELDKIFGPFGSNAAHPSDLYTQAEFKEAVRLLTVPTVPLMTVMQFVEGNNWSLSSAGLAALRQRGETDPYAVQRVLRQCEHYSPWTMHFALEFLFQAEPRILPGEPVMRARDWWADNRWMPNIFRDYLERCSLRGDKATFGGSGKLKGLDASAKEAIKKFLERVPLQFAGVLAQELDLHEPSADELDGSESSGSSSPPTLDNTSVLFQVGRFWNAQDFDFLVEPEAWRKAFASAGATLQQNPARSVLVSGETLVGKTSFLSLLAKKIAPAGWSVFEARGADLQANQIYIGQLEGRIRQVLDELAKARRTIWYIPDIVQLAMSGTHSGQSASILDQIIPAISAGRLVVWAEASPKGMARLLRINPSLRGLFETVTIEPMSADDALSLTRDVMRQMERANIRFAPDCAEVARDTVGQYMGSNALPGSVLLMLKLTAVRAEKKSEIISSRQILETFSQLSGLPLSILDTREQLDLAAVREFFNARVLGQDEAVGAVVDRVAMLKAGLNDPGKPIGVFLFAGPTGTGKTELAKTVSEFLFGSAERLIRLDMSEFQTHDSMSKILGQSTASAFETDSLIGRVRKQPFSVLLLDEFEKSHPMIWDLFLQAFDEGRLTDAMGQTADLRHCLIILTSNLGATSHRSLGLGFAPQEDVFTKEQVLRAIAQTYRPEFQNRLDKVIVFRPLTRELMRGILKKELAALLDRRGLKDRAWAIEWESSALEFLLERGFSPEMGARPLKRAIDQYVVAPLAAIIVEKRFPEGEQFLFVRSDGNGIQAEFVDPDAEPPADGEAFAVEPGVAAPSSLAAVVLTPSGSRAEYQMLQDQYADIERILQSAEWIGLKDNLAADMATAEFWTRPDRFGVLARFALMDRVKSATETANALRGRLQRYSRSPSHYSTQLSGRLASQLFLIREGIVDAFEDAPIELALAIEPVFEGTGDRLATLGWCQRLRSMYRAWADKRRMQIAEIEGAGRDKETPILMVSGFGAYRIMAPEAGLHVFEQSEGAVGRVTARVRLAAVPLGDVPAAKERKLIVKALDEAPRINTVVRRYREEPPLVRDAAGKWRSGRLDLVLGGDFDLLQAGER